MKWMIFSGCIIFVLASMASVSYGGMQKVTITKENFADLKGKWIGTRSVGPSPNLNTDLEILNDSPPVEGKFIFYDVQRQDKTGSTVSGSTVVVDFKGKINDQGNLVISGGNMDVELSLYEDGGKKKLEGNFFIRGARGTMSFKKK